MTLSEFSLLVDASPKWVLNARGAIGRAPGYSVAAAERLGIVRVLNRDFAIPLPRAWDLAGSAVASGREIFIVSSHEGTVEVRIDIARIRAAISARRSRHATMHAPRRAGRRARKPPNAIVGAERYGLDIGLLMANLARRPAERLRQLDAMVAFRSRVRRKDAP